MKKLIFALAICTAALTISSCDKTEVTKDNQSVVVQPTWGEAYHYANAATPSQVSYTILGLSLIIGWAVLAYFLNKKMKKSPIAFIVISWFVMWAFGIGSLIGKPNSVRIQNVKTVPKDYYDRVGQTYILDSLFNHNLMVDAAVK